MLTLKDFHGGDLDSVEKRMTNKESFDESEMLFVILNYLVAVNEKVDKILAREEGTT